MYFNILNESEKAVILNKATEPPFSGKYLNYKRQGTYLCRQCNKPLFSSDFKFDSGTGWPSFDDCFENAINFVPDQDQIRTEIVCANCGAHLGHIFFDEGFTPKNKRFCTNSISLYFINKKIEPNIELERAIFAGGCFWGVEYLMQKAKGVVYTAVGYIGGHLPNPSYEMVCSSKTGHAEAVEVFFDRKQTSFENLAQLFFEIHDPTQLNRQGPDVGEQYRSEIFYTNENQKNIALKLIDILKNKGYNVVTKVSLATEFYVAEEYHQKYYQKTGSMPYCHYYVKRF